MSRSSASVPTLARARWSTHARYPEQVLLLGSHANFRRISRTLVDAAERGDELQLIASLYLRWIAAMRSHEGYEEHKLYPYLGRRFGLDLSPAEAGHAQLHDRHDEVVAAMVALAEARASTADRALAGALSAHDEILTTHLELEEDMVIPCLLALEPEEFRAYTTRPIEVLLATLEA